MAIALSLAGACSPEQAPRGGAAASDTVGKVAVVADSSPADTAWLIAPDRIGSARRGRTLGELRSAVTAGVHIGSPDPRFMVDLVAIAVTTGTDTLYHLLFPAGSAPADTTRLQLVATLNTKFRTPDDVGPGTTLASAAAKYGAPMLSYSINDESREYAAFPGYRHAAVRFRVRPGSDSMAFAGVYTTRQEYNETQAHDPDAVIWMVIVDLQRR